MNKKCVYTAVTGGYDKLMQPKVIDKTYDFICFSNDIHESTVGVWQIKPIPFSHKDNTRVSRFPKFHPHKLLSEYDFSIYIDANNLILDDFIYRRAEQLYSEHEMIGSIVHPYRNCVYKEIFDCLYQGSDKTWPLIKSLWLHVRENFPRNIGLFENNLIFWNHHDSKVVQVLDLFWDIYMSHSHRDQLALRLAYYKNNITPALFLPCGEHMGNSEHIKRVDHLKKDCRHNNSRRAITMKKIRIRFIRFIFLLMGYNFTYRKLYSD